MISIIHPSRSRPEMSSKTISKWINQCSDRFNFEIIVSLDVDDPNLNDYKKIYFQFHGIYAAYNNRSAIDAINNAAKIARGDIIMVVSDDTDCFPGWDTALLKEVKGKTDWILKTQDGIQKYIITMPVMDRVYYNRFGYVYYPEYKHMFCDLELTCVADLTGRKLTSNLMFPHNHYSLGKAQKDQVSIKADATWNQGEKLFIERYRKSFDLKLKDIKGQITDRGMIDWITNKR